MRICTRVSLWLEFGKAGKARRSRLGSTSKLLVDAEYLGLGCETLGLGSWMPGVWRGALPGGRQLEVGGGGTGSGGREGGVRVSHKLGRGLYLVGTAAFYGRELRTHMFPVINSHMCTHASWVCEHGWKRLRAEDL